MSQTNTREPAQKPSGNVLSVEFYNQVYTKFNQGAAAAIVVLLMVAMIPIMAFQVRQFRQEAA